MQEDLIESRIGVHDSKQFEVKLDYSIEPDARRSRYRIESYFFIPKSLGITSATYSRDQFYNDLQAYIRFRTPSVSLASIAQSTGRRSPLRRIAGTLEKLQEDPRRKKYQRSLSRQLRLLGCLVRANVRDRSNAVIRMLARVGAEGAKQRTLVTDARDAADALLLDVEKFLRKFRAIRAPFLDPIVPDWVREVYAHVDEYLSVSVETHFTELLRAIDEAPGAVVGFGKIREGVTACILAEREHRVGAGYPSVLNGAHSHEHFVYRRGLLKKLVMSVLFLEIKKQREGTQAFEFAAAIAAGIAMLMTVLATVWAQQRYGLDTLAFAIAAVGTYMLKDRAKDWLKRAFSSSMTRWLWDYNVSIRDPDRDATIGRCREAVSYISKRAVPADVLQKRHEDSSSPLEDEMRQEVVIKYEKSVRLNRIKPEQHGLLSDINDIIRFNISSFLVRTDDPVQLVQHYDSTTDQVEMLQCPKVYHLNVVFVLRSRGGVASMERVRVILDKSGIRRLESVRPFLGPSSESHVVDKSRFAAAI